MCGSNYSLAKEEAAHVISPQFHPRDPDPNPMVIYLPFPLDSLWLFLTALVVQESFLLSLVFSEDFSTCMCDVFMREDVICISEVIDISPGNLDSSLCFFQPSVSHDVLCIKV